jgi:hypothetical protein
MADYAKEFAIQTITDKTFEIPMTTVYNQFDTLKCTGFAGATTAEILFGKRFSAGWILSQSKNKNQIGEGRFLINVLEAMKNVGCIPLYEFDGLFEDDEFLEKVKDNDALLKTASRYKIDGFCNIFFADRSKRDTTIKDAIKRYADKKRVAVIATSNSYFGENHSIVLVGWNDKNNTYIFHNSQGKGYKNGGRGEIPKNKIDAVYAVYKNMSNMPFKDLTTKNWSYEDIKIAYDAGFVNGKKANILSPNDFVTREEMFAVIGRILRAEYNWREREILLNYQGDL